jgi:hypothetical protein
MQPYLAVWDNILVIPGKDGAWFNILAKEIFCLQAKLLQHAKNYRKHKTMAVPLTSACSTCQREKV